MVPTGSMASVDSTSYFRRARAHPRFQHPSLAAEGAPDTKNFTYTVPADGSALDAWVSLTFGVATDPNCFADTIVTFQPTPYVKLVYTPRSGELFGHPSRGRSDAAAACRSCPPFLGFRDRVTFCERVAAG
ncbi:hypothetical protein F5X97DRAFT_302773 [Nemania serpens]|nr:hypothetical protein F5X97DRAFT_302773 [Nemania serpens]